MNRRAASQCSCRNTVEKHEVVVPKSLNLHNGLFAIQCFQWVSLWTKRLLSRALNTYDSRLDFIFLLGQSSCALGNFPLLIQP